MDAKRKPAPTMPKNDQGQSAQIMVSNLNVTYGGGRRQEIPALRDISLAIYPGEFVIFYGPSGCGKSTLLYSIAGLETHAKGTILVNGHSVTTLAPPAAARFRQHEIGMIFQAFYLIPSLSVIANVILPQMAAGVLPVDRIKRARELLDHFGVLSQANKLSTDLSGGQQQRVAICRALVNDPDIILADEPVGNLDSKSAGDVLRLILELNVQRKKTVILVTHDPSHLHYADRVFSMRDGRIIETKVNRATKELPTPAAQSPIMSKDLALLVQSFSSLKPDQIGTMLIPFKAKEIVAEVFTGLSVEELARIEHEVQSVMISGTSDEGDLTYLLDQPERFGGLGLDRRTAQKLAERMIAVTNGIRQLQEFEREKTMALPREVVAIREQLQRGKYFNFDEPDRLHVLDLVIWKRVTNKLNQAELIAGLQVPMPVGPSLSQAAAEKMAKRIELLILGKYGS